MASFEFTPRRALVVTMLRILLAGGLVGTAAIAASPVAVTFHKDVLPILQKNCHEFISYESLLDDNRGPRQQAPPPREHPQQQHGPHSHSPRPAVNSVRRAAHRRVAVVAASNTVARCWISPSPCRSSNAPSRFWSAAKSVRSSVC